MRACAAGYGALKERTAAYFDKCKPRQLQRRPRESNVIQLRPEAESTAIVPTSIDTVTCTIGPVSIDGVRIADGDAWLTQKQMAELFGVERNTITEHTGAVHEDGEVDWEATCRTFRLVRTEGNRTVSRNVCAYSTPLVLAVGYRVRSSRGVEFRQWVTSVLQGTAPTSNALAVPNAELAQVIASLQLLVTSQQQQREATDVLSARVDMLAGEVALVLIHSAPARAYVPRPADLPSARRALRFR